MCHLTSVHDRYDIRIFEKECKSLVNHGFDVSLIVNDDLGDEVVSGIKILSTNFKPKNRIQRMLGSNKKMFEKALEVNADIYHFHDPELLPVGNKLKRLGKKVIFDSHENYPYQLRQKDYLPKIFRNLISKIYFKYETYSVKKYDAVIFPCTYSAKDPFENRSKKTVFLDNFPMLEELYDCYTEEGNKLPNSVCYIGSLTIDRGITNIMEAAYLAKAKLILGGVFTSSEYHQDLKKRNEYSCVDYLGFLNRDEVVNTYKQCRIGLSTLLNIGQYNKGDHFATKVYEYMSMGLPVVLTDSPYVREVLKRYKFGIPVNPEDVNEISEAIVYLLNNPEVAKKMGENGRLAIKEKFNWGVEEKKLIALYSSL
ncbi:glycosyltransferase involved in cell wall bisynthesis [Ureibacillus xyleni]|uniref:Glycosyltransferase involved in cell wall bisynthesis n=1 Tax=Ureibacillus xyleni TaxID=614648 RepID=A0A285RHS9_9BACL|nr:glycosyltransferase [Ureibacillus xyleni]SOB93666.1 glycosyltransferase involved in cell wall bisynthesis [Ureibacillus xyleni]